MDITTIDDFTQELAYRKVAKAVSFRRIQKPTDEGRVANLLTDKA